MAQSSSKSSLPKAYDVEARDREERKRKRREGDEGREELDSFPVMMSFKAFLETQDDSITDEEALVKYGEYKMEFKRQKINEFFVCHKNEEWFRNKYHPDEANRRQQKTRKSVRQRLDIFNDLLEKGLLDGILCTTQHEPEIVKLLDSVVILLEGGSYEDLKNLDNEENNNDHVKHKSSSIFIRNLHPTIKREDLCGLVEKYPGFQRLAISESDPKNNFSRRCWVSFQRNAKIREICYAITNTPIKGLEVQAVVNKDLSKRTRALEPLLSAEAVLEKDLKIAMAIVKFQDARQGLYQTDSKASHDSLKSTNNTENAENVPPQEGGQEKSFEEKSTEKAAPLQERNPILIEAQQVCTNTNAGGQDDDKQEALDKVLLYLRIVHSIDFYSQKDYRGEDDMPNRCGLMHIRHADKKDFDEAEVSKFLLTREEKYTEFISNPVKVDEVETKKLGLKDEAFEIDKFVSANSQELAKDKWLCTLSGKKFKAMEFIKKHLLNKFEDKVNEVKTEVKFFNNYILDPDRPQLPDEKLHPANTASQPTSSSPKKMRSDMLPASSTSYEKKAIHARLGVREAAAAAKPTTARPVRVTYANTDPRGLIDYSDIDSSVFDMFG